MIDDAAFKRVVFDIFDFDTPCTQACAQIPYVIEIRYVFLVLVSEQYNIINYVLPEAKAYKEFSSKIGILQNVVQQRDLDAAL